MFKNILANYFGKFWSVISNFLFIPLYINLLGFDSYVVVTFSLVIAGFIIILDSGLSATLLREFARIDRSTAEKKKTFETLETIYIIIVLLILVTTFLSAEYISTMFFTDSNFSISQLSFFCKLMGIDIAFQMLFRFYLGGFYGFEKQVKANLIQFLWSLFRNGIVLIALYFKPDLTMFFTWQFSVTIVFCVLVRFLLMKELDGKTSSRFRFRIRKSELKRVGRFSAGIFLIGFVGAINTQLDKLVIGKMISVTELANYTIAATIGMGIIGLLRPISLALLPRFTLLYSSGKKEEALNIFSLTNTIVSIIVFSFVANIALFSEELLWVWSNDLVLAKNVSIFLPYAVFSAGMISLDLLPYNIAISNGYTFLNNIIGILSLIITVPGYFVITKMYGAEGTAMVYCFVQTGMTIIYYYFINRKFLKISNYRLYVKGMLIPFLLSIASTLIFVYLMKFVPQSRFAQFFVISSSVCISMILSLIILIDKKVILSYLHKINFRKIR